MKNILPHNNVKNVFKYTFCTSSFFPLLPNYSIKFMKLDLIFKLKYKEPLDGYNETLLKWNL